MYHFDSQLQQKTKDAIREMWHRLTDEEVDAMMEHRDLFFMAVRKKHGVLRAQAEILLNDLVRAAAGSASLHGHCTPSTAGGKLL